MTRRIATTFARLREERCGALMPFVTVGDPSPAASPEILRAVVRGGADLIELGFPYSDPLADGPAIQQSSQRALAAGTTLDQVFAIAAGLRRETEIPLVLMTYFNPILQRGPERYLATAKEVGIDGLIVPDLPPDEGHDFYAACDAAGIDPVLLLAPTSTDDRIQLACAGCRGFLYYVSLTGITGARANLATDLAEKLGHIRTFTTLPLAVGFGVSTPDHVAQVTRVADGAIVGSALVCVIEQHRAVPDLAERVTAFVASLAAGVRGRTRKS
jgi:tryptophan synthase alpha chain